jgi:hypothetical protein
MITVVNKYKHTSDPNDEYIGRGSALGNPYTSIKDRTTKADFICESTEESISKFKVYLLEQIENDNPAICNALKRIFIKANKGNVNLVCFCSPKPCHGNIIKEIIESHM